MENGAIRLTVLLFVGFLFLEIGLTGRLGSILASCIDPANMEAKNDTSNASNTTSSPSIKTSVQTSIASVFGPYAAAATQIANAESGFNPNAVNPISIQGSNATGIFQILYPGTWNTTSYASGNPKDAVTNIKAAYEIFKRDGNSWREWATAPGLGLK